MSIPEGMHNSTDVSTKSNPAYGTAASITGLNLYLCDDFFLKACITPLMCLPSPIQPMAQLHPLQF